MTKLATETVRINLTLDKASFDKLAGIAAKNTMPGNRQPSNQAVVRMAIAEYLKAEEHLVS